MPTAFTVPSYHFDRALPDLVLQPRYCDPTDVCTDEIPVYWVAERYYWRLHSAVYILVTKPLEVNDVLITVLQKALAKPHSERPKWLPLARDQTVYPYLNRQAYNETVDLNRKHGKLSVTTNEMLENNLKNLANNFFHSMTEREDWEQIKSQLTNTEKATFEVVSTHPLNYREMAERLNVTYATFRNRMYKLENKIRRILDSLR